MYLKRADSCSLICSMNKKSLHKQQGNMIVMALFIIVVGGFLVASLIKALNASSASTIQQVYGLRAELAAQSGIQTALEFSFPNNGVAQACNQTLNSPSSFANVDGLRFCSFSTVCTTEVINFQSINYNYYKFSSTGSCTIDNSVVSRTVSVDAITE